MTRIPPTECELEDPAVVLVDLYSSLTEPVLRFDVQSPLALAYLVYTLRRLSTTPGLEIKLDRKPSFLITSSINKLVLRSLGGGATFSKAVFLKQKPPQIMVEWRNPCAAWLHCAELLEGLTKPGHQYLNSSPLDEATIEVSFQEVDLRIRAKQFVMGDKAEEF